MTASIQIAASWSAKVDRRGGPNACWPWTGSTTVTGYGLSRVKEGGRWRTAGAHQIAHYLATGRWERREDGRLVRHLCHNRPCCNPAHLRGGTPKDNARDRFARVSGRALVRTNPFLLPVAGVANRVFLGEAA
ncbi:HNH endonuclease [Brevundimonas sp. A19_0]|uniref:HNH endonuclease n=1 Tax=Brevundimonas sp. A19_0 TaxID=2821087 RepID=UPI001ADB9719|nr:HNH endonuclease [Brevundimonas sp. A19_0]MBO9502042.1 HNH endonuclease [Brevundimonas sp. A19_0]